MKIFNLFLGAAFLLFTIVSCTIKEEIYLNEDGSGKYETYIDFTDAMQFMGEELKNDSTFSTKDTLISFADIVKENMDPNEKLSPEKMQLMNAMKEFKLQMKISEDVNSPSFMKLFSDFENLNDLNITLNNMSEFSSIMDGEENTKLGLDEANGLFSSASEMNFTGRKFTREYSSKSIALMDSLSEEDLGMLKMMIQDFKIIYHFPRPIKSVNIEDAKLSQDRKTLSIYRDFTEYLENPKLNNLEVKLER